MRWFLLAMAGLFGQALPTHTASAEAYWKGAAVLSDLTANCPTQMFEEMGGFALDSTLRPAGVSGNGPSSYLTLGAGSRVRVYNFFEDDLREPRVTQPAVFYVREKGRMWGVVEWRTGGRITPVGFNETTKNLRLRITLHNVRGITGCDLTVTGTYVKAN